MTTNRNEVERFDVSTERLDALFARSNEQAEADQEARQRAAEWPSQVNHTVSLLVRELIALRERVAAIEAQAKG